MHLFKRKVSFWEYLDNFLRWLFLPRVDELAEAGTVDIMVPVWDLGAAMYLEPRFIVVQGCSLPLYLYTRYA